MNLPDQQHPIWRLSRLAVCLVALTCIMYFNAQDFDETELRAIFWFFLAVSSAETVGEVVKRVRTLRNNKINNI
jgi:hypothetical protein